MTGQELIVSLGDASMRTSEGSLARVEPNDLIAQMVGMVEPGMSRTKAVSQLVRTGVDQAKDIALGVVEDDHLMGELPCTHARRASRNQAASFLLGVRGEEVNMHGVLAGFDVVVHSLDQQRDVLSCRVLKDKVGIGLPRHLAARGEAPELCKRIGVIRVDHDLPDSHGLPLTVAVEILDASADEGL